jgi:MFS family permease
MNSLGTSYLSPYALALNATSSQIGILHALSSLFPSFVQLKACRLIEKFSRKKVVLFGVLMQALMFLPIIATGVLFYYGIWTDYLIWLLIGFITLFYAFGSAVHPMWFSWMGSLVKEEERGRYFSKRNRITGFFGVISMVAGALILDYANAIGYVLVGFGVLFVLAFTLRMFSLNLLKQQYEPKIKVKKRDYFTFFQFLKRAPETAFGRFSIFNGFMRIAVGISAPFWVVYILRELGYSYFWYMVVVVAGVSFQLAWYPILGKISDRFGNAWVLKFSSLMLVLVPLLWVISPYLGLSSTYLMVYLIFVPQFFSGLAWAGFNLSTNNYIYDSVKEEKRSFGSAYSNFISGIGTFAGAGIGSFLVLFDVGFMNIILFAFLISGILRLLVIGIGARYLREVRHVKKFSVQYVMREFRPAQGIVKEVHYFKNIIDKVEHFV